MTSKLVLPKQLFARDRRINLYYLHESFRAIAAIVADTMQKRFGIEVPITAGMWGGSYLVAGDDGRARTNVVRLYSIVNLPQNSPLDDKENFERLMVLYHQTFQSVFKSHALNLVDPHWGEPIPYSNRVKPTTTLQMWDTTGRIKFVRAFFVWNEASWEESIIYDAVRNVMALKELLDLNQRPGKRASDEMKFLLQDVLITYFTLKPALTPDFEEHANPIIEELFQAFLAGLHDPEAIEEQFHRVYSNALVYGYEEALAGPYGKHGLDIKKIEDWPVEKINWVPQELNTVLGPYLRETFKRFKDNLGKNST